VRHIIRYLDAGGSVIFVGHAPHQAQAICRRGIMLEHGRMTYSGSITDTLDRYLSVLRDEALRSNPGEADVADVTAHPRAAASSRLAGATSSGKRDSPRLPPLTAEEPVVIDALTVQPVSGDVLLLGEEAVISVHYRALVRFDDVTFSFSVFTADQWVCITVLACPPFTVHPGSAGMTARVRLPLLPGNYIVKAALVDRAAIQPIALLGWQNAAPLFKITGSPDWNRVALAAINPLIAVDAVWSASYGRHSSIEAGADARAEPAAWPEELEEYDSVTRRRM
jgi:hypothetical protein